MAGKSVLILQDTLACLNVIHYMCQRNPCALLGYKGSVLIIVSLGHKCVLRLYAWKRWLLEVSIFLYAFEAFSSQCLCFKWPSTPDRLQTRTKHPVTGNIHLQTLSPQASTQLPVTHNLTRTNPVTSGVHPVTRNTQAYAYKPRHLRSPPSYP